MNAHAQLTARDIHGPFMQILTNLQSEDGQTWLSALKRFLRKEEAWTRCAFRTWKRIQLGTFKTTEALERALEKAGIDKKHEFVQQMLKRTHIIPLKRTVELVCVTPRELGMELLPNPKLRGDRSKNDPGICYADICARAYEKGLELCPAETGPQLRLQFLDQPLQETLRVASEPVCDATSRRNIYEVGNWESIKLGFANGNNNAYYRTLDTKFVFVRR